MKISFNSHEIRHFVCHEAGHARPTPQTYLKNLLTRLLGFPATLVHGDTLVLDRWNWLCSQLPLATQGESLLDVGCSTGAFTIGMARRGYNALGLTWDQPDTRRAVERAKICNAPLASFSIQDVRNLDERKEFFGKFDRIICTENIEHILDDQKLMIDMANCLRPGGKLYLTTPNFYFKPISAEDDEPLSTVEDGGHVRRGYTPEDFKRLCARAGLQIEEIGYVSVFLSQKITGLWRALNRLHPLASFALVLPFRIFPPIFDGGVTGLLKYPKYSISLIAKKP